MMPETDTLVAGVASPTGPGRDTARGTPGRLGVDFLLAGLLLGVVVWGALYVLPAISGSAADNHKPLLLVLVSALLPIATVMLLSCIERLFPPAGPRKSARTWFLHLHIHILYIFLAAIAATLTTTALRALELRFGVHLGLIDLRFATGKGLVAMAAAVWVSMAAGDFFFYWFHRALHRSTVLWQHHKLHHMDEELEAITINRQNWIEVFIAAVLIYAPTAIVFRLDKLDPTQLGVVAGVFTTAFGLFLGIGHMNVRFQVGRASLFYCSPQMHRIHHSRLPQHQDRNFAFVLPLWDVLFGTYYAPARDEFPPTGVEGEREISSFWEAEIFSQREWWRMFRARHARRDSLPG
jgi:sterol desaturase/sphingolipid hydroxylase (fatty acid hydroxylase superfamily)